jgi:hypothetical protein
LKLTEIALGWFNVANASPAQQQMIHYRLAICDECPNKAQLSPIGKRVVEAINDKASTFYCKNCGCPLASKTASPGSTCPISKWSQWIEPQTYY